MSSEEEGKKGEKDLQHKKKKAVKLSVKRPLCSRAGGNFY
jgi:hypothetical protein